MKRLTGVLIAIVIACDAIGAQNGNGRLPEADAIVVQSSPPSQQGQAAPTEPKFIFKPTFRLPIELQQSGAPTTPSLHEKVMGPAQFVIRDGALFIDVLGNGTLLPVAGGGASGCFGWDSEKKFKSPTMVLALPTRLLTSTSR